jgi:hypothetical protein
MRCLLSEDVEPRSVIKRSMAASEQTGANVRVFNLLCRRSRWFAGRVSWRRLERGPIHGGIGDRLSVDGVGAEKEDVRRQLL